MIGYRLTPESISTEEKSILTWHRIIEAFKFAYAKRTNIGDSDQENETFRLELEEVSGKRSREIDEVTLKVDVGEGDKKVTRYVGFVVIVKKIKCL